ncbi:alpha/beta hydrolase [uncultured Subdoligranulum sp.]|uniref:alpha/beta hydrolase n=1 Tax=uncultured Subdoligranulum sp. TaxID=512298 RepID=UPI0025E6F735|nr:alpha/beta hydrolase [uncultured Subdoligranulum sp.]
MSRRTPKDLTQRLETVIKTLIPQRGQSADELGPMMRAIKAVHSVTDNTSTSPEDLERQRAAQELFGRLVAPSIGIRNDGLTVGEVPAEWVSLEHGHDRRHAVLYCHGGGYTCGQLAYARILASKLALCTGFDVLSFEYRLAPEHRYPAALQDALAMWDYLMYMGYGARDVIVAGDSAGGNLALELCLKLKAQGRAQPRGLLLFSPWTDMTATGKSYRTCRNLDPLLTLEYVEAVRAAYTGPDADWADPRYSPLFADLRGMPPTLVQVGTNEILRSDSERLAEALQKAGGYAKLEVYEECWHVFQQMPIHRAEVAMESAGRFVQRLM